MGSPRRRPAPKGPLLDAVEIASVFGCDVDDVYAMARVGQMPAPVNAQFVRSPQRWRWSRRLVGMWLDGRWTPKQVAA